MSNISVTSSGKISKKKARKLIFEKLAGALAEFKPSVKEKKFTSRLKKASKLFAADIAKTISKKSKPEKKATKKPLAKKPELTNEAV